MNECTTEDIIIINLLEPYSPVFSSVSVSLLSQYVCLSLSPLFHTIIIMAQFTFRSIFESAAVVDGHDCAKGKRRPNAKAFTRMLAQTGSHNRRLEVREMWREREKERAADTGRRRSYRKVDNGNCRNMGKRRKERGELSDRPSSNDGSSECKRGTKRVREVESDQERRKKRVHAVESDGEKVWLVERIHSERKRERAKRKLLSTNNSDR